MLTVYYNDIEGFSKSDWASLLDNPDVMLESGWEGWKCNRRTLFKVPCQDLMRYPSAWEDCPVKEFIFDLGCKGEEVAYSGELECLLADLARLDAVKHELDSLRLYDGELDEEMDFVADRFADAYDRACARALSMLLKELFAARES